MLRELDPRQHGARPGTEDLVLFLDECRCLFQETVGNISRCVVREKYV